MSRSLASVRFSLTLAVACALIAPQVHAGAFLNPTAGKVTHAGAYQGTSGERVIDVCLDPAAMPVSGDPTQATANAVAEFNRLEGTLGNVVDAVTAGVPGGQLDYQSFLMHEMGHCLGLDHNVLGPFEVSCSVGGTCINSPTLFFAISTDGGNGFNTNAGGDNARATGDDVRGNDTNRLWYRANSNNPFVEAPIADRTTYVQSGSLAGDSFAEASASFAPCSQGTATVNTAVANGQPNTTDVLVPILCANNVVRDLSPNDRTMFRIARAGSDGVANTADDYTVRLNFQGTTQAGCDLQIRFPSGGGFFCDTDLGVLGNGDFTIEDNPLPADPDQFAGIINLQREVPWHFNQTDTTGGSCIFRQGFEDTTPACN